MSSRAGPGLYETMGEAWLDWPPPPAPAIVRFGAEAQCLTPDILGVAMPNEPAPDADPMRDTPGVCMRDAPGVCAGVILGVPVFGVSVSISMTFCSHCI